jgi:uncharacterized membrane protein HdeD (DUF308 family)
MFRNWWLLALKGLVLLLMGIFILFNPDLALDAIIFYLGLLALVGGVAEVALAVLNRERPQWTGSLLEGLLDIGIGVLLLTKPVVAELLPIILGIWIVASGVMLLIRAFRSRQAGQAAWMQWLLLSALLIAIGLWVIYDPRGTLVSFTLLMGTAMLAFGLLVLLIALRLRGTQKELRKAAEELGR